MDAYVIDYMDMGLGCGILGVWDSPCWDTAVGIHKGHREFLYGIAMGILYLCVLVLLRSQFSVLATRLEQFRDSCTDCRCSHLDLPT